MGLYQHVGFATHQAGNTLDLVLSDITSSARVLSTSPGPFLTDHCAVICTLNIKRLEPITVTGQVRQVSKVDDDQWKDEFNPDNIELNSKLDILVSSFNTELKQVYDTLALPKECRVDLRPKQPWFDSEVKQLKRKVCKYGKKWLKYKYESLVHL